MDEVNRALGDTADGMVGKVQDTVEDDLEQIDDAVERVQSTIQKEGCSEGSDGEKKEEEAKEE